MQICYGFYCITEDNEFKITTLPLQMTDFFNVIKVNDIDEGILKFVNLKELILTANYINKIDGKKLPRGLEVVYENVEFRQLFKAILIIVCFSQGVRVNC